MHSRLWYTAAFVALSVSLSGCNALKMDPVADTTARLAYEHLAKGEDEALQNMFEPAQRGPQMGPAFAQMRSFLPPGQPDKFEATGWNNNASTGEGVTTTLTHTYTYGAKLVTATTLLARNGKEAWWVRGMNVKLSFPTAAEGAPVKTE
jgi:hypothetical protein